ncbi:hypothetical protein, partial [Burkholderia ambifaria]|uniref:hypothetical protein n=1 Tax=Burkholderia ambifaria TaxID=152480 RepID=UPI001ABB1093
CIPCSKIEQGIQSRGSKFDENYCLRWVNSAWTSTVSEADQLLMRRIDELHMEFPFAGARMLARLLRREG